MIMTTTENQLIERFKSDFLLATGRIAEVKVLDKWDELCLFDRGVSFWTICKMVFDATGWTREGTFKKTNHGGNKELASRRRVIDLIAINNGCKLMYVGRQTDRDHTTIIHSVKTAKDLIEADVVYRKLVREVMDFIRTNYEAVYKDKVITREEC